MKRARRVFTVLGMAVGLCVPNLAAALAAPPSNDTLADAVEVSSIPFDYREDTSEATASGATECGDSSSVFFRFTPTTDVSVHADTFGSNYDTILTVFTRAGGINEIVTCNDDVVGLQSAVRFDAHAGTTYYLQVSACCESGQDNVGGRLALAVRYAPTTSPEVTANVDPEIRMKYRGGVVHVTGTLTCNQRVAVDVAGVLRQTNENVVARALFDARRIATCDPERALNRWGAWADTDTGAAFQEGRASIRVSVFASNGFASFFGDQKAVHVQIVRG